MTKGKDYIALNVLAYMIIGIMAIVAVAPFLILLVSSFQSEDTILRMGYSLVPREIDFTAYEFIFKSPAKILHSYSVTIFITVVGTSASLFFSSMAAYVLSRKDVRYRNQLSFYIFFTTLFSGGLVPYYLLVSNYLMLRNTIYILLFSGLFNAVYVLIIRTNIKSNIHDSLSESAKIDGANDFVIFIKIILPLLKSSLASIGLFVALGYWNDWFTSSLFIDNESLYPLQYLLYKMLSFTSIAQKLFSQNGAVSSMKAPSETIKLAMTIVATGPIILAYPFAQKYFVEGMTIGAVKG